MRLAKDVQFGWRWLRRSPAFTAVAVLTMALGIGANTAVFSVVNAALLTPLPYTHPGQLVSLGSTQQTPGIFPVSGPDFRDWQRQAKSFRGMSLYESPVLASLLGRGAPQELQAGHAERNFFEVLGVTPVLGHTFRPGSRQAVALLSYGFWQSEFGGSPNVVGRSLAINGAQYTVIGVLPASFRWQSRLQVWVPLNLEAAMLGRRGWYSFHAIARLQPGVTLAQGQAELSALAAHLAREYPVTNHGIGIRVLALRHDFLGAGERAALLTLLAVVGLVLLIACANLASMLLARGLRRRKEIAVRLTLGARRGQIAAQLLTEAVLLAVLGGIVGTALAWIALRSVLALPALAMTQRQPVHMSLAVLAFTAIAALVSGILFGLVPAWQLTRAGMQSELAGAASAAGGRGRLSHSLIVAEVALSMVLLVLAGMFLQSFARMRSRSLGINPSHLLTMQLAFSGFHGVNGIDTFGRQFLQRLQARPGIEAASFASELPLEGGRNNGWPVLANHAGPVHVLVEGDRVSPGFFRTMQMPLLAGSLYTPAQLQAWRQAAPRYWSQHGTAAGLALDRFHLSLVVNQAFAQTLFPGQNPIGQRFRDDQYSPWVSIQGVVGNMPVLGARETKPMPEVFFPVLSLPYLLVRSRLAPAAVVAEVRGVLAQMQAPLPVFHVRTMAAIAGQASGGAALQSGLMAAFAALALLLAAAGIYGVMAYLVAGRRQEIGVRMALGADGGAVAALVLGGCLRLAIAGVAIGAVAAVLAQHWVRSQLYQVPGVSVGLMVLAAAVLIAASLLASYVPARRAAGTDPAQVLRAH
ncbi:MAG: ABC transporter permease [Acidobacteria bacterium]|nr:MAG: ABC transporter permease [Acidobacteriota bacterium]